MSKSSHSWDPVAHFDQNSDRVTILATLLRQLVAIHVAAKAATDIQESIRSGQGFMLSAAQKKAVELRAMAVAEAALSLEG